VSVLGRIAAWPVRVYRRFLSPLKPPMCRFQPTCSQYAIEALTLHGLFKGTLLATWRLMRCQPFARDGRDPVPPKGAWRNVQREREHHEHAHCGSISGPSDSAPPSAEA
jgi:uncharacterized protein